MRLMLFLIACSLALAACSRPNDETPSSTQPDRAGPCDGRIEELRTTIREQARTVKVFVVDSAAPDAEALAKRMEGIEGVERVEVVTKEQALERAKELFADSPGVMENLPGNPFPASIELTVDPDRSEEVARAAERISGADYAESGGARHSRLLQMLVADYERGDKKRVCERLDVLEQQWELDAPDGDPGARTANRLTGIVMRLLAPRFRCPNCWKALPTGPFITRVLP